MENIYSLLTQPFFLLLTACIVVTVMGIWLFYRRTQQRNQLLLHSGGEQASHVNYADPPLIEDTAALTDPLFDDDFDADDVALIESPASEEAPAPVASAKPQDAPKPLIIVLYVLAQDEQGFNGLDIFAVLEELGLKHGQMQIFHHYGLGDAQAKQAVFSVASMLEPGILKRDNIEQFYTPGMVFFMQVPGPVGGRVAFELMLSQTHKFAEELNGQLQDEHHDVLTPEITEILRERIAEFEQR